MCIVTVHRGNFIWEQYNCQNILYLIFFINLGTTFIIWVYVLFGNATLLKFIFKGRFFYIIFESLILVNKLIFFYELHICTIFLISHKFNYTWLPVN